MKIVINSCRCPKGDGGWPDIVTCLLFQSHFCMNRPSGFSIHRDAHSCLSCAQSQRAFFIYFFVPYFCLDRPFGFSIHREAHFCLGRPFGFSTYHAVLFIFLGKVFLDYISIHWIWKFYTIHVCKD